MNTFNRVVIVILLLVLIPTTSVLFVIPHRILYNVGTWMRGVGEQLDQMRPILRLPIGILLALAFDLLAALLVYFEVRRTRKRFIRVQELSGGMATLSIESIVEQLQYHLDPLPDVIKVSPEVQAKGNKVQATVDVTVRRGANVPQMAAELVERVKQVLVEDLGLSVASDPQVRIRVAPKPSERSAQKSRRPKSMPSTSLAAPTPAAPEAHTPTAPSDDRPAEPAEETPDA